MSGLVSSRVKMLLAARVALKGCSVQSITVHHRPDTDCSGTRSSSLAGIALFYTIYYTVCKIKFKIVSDIESEIRSLLLEIVTLPLRFPLAV
jgi:hypothetical protein